MRLLAAEPSLEPFHGSFVMLYILTLVKGHGSTHGCHDGERGEGFAVTASW
jgi:hypothetical protein